MVAQRQVFELHHNQVRVARLVDGCLEVAANDEVLVGYAVAVRRCRSLSPAAALERLTEVPDFEPDSQIGISCHMVGEPDMSSATARHIIDLRALLEQRSRRRARDYDQA